MSITTTQLIGMIEAAYRVENGEGAWLSGVLDSFRVARADAAGWSGYFVDASDPDLFETWGYADIGELKQGAEGFRRWNLETPTAVKRLIHFHAPCNYGRFIPAPEALAEDLERTRATHQEVEMFGLNAL